MVQIQVLIFYEISVFRPFWLEKFNAIVNQYNSLNKDLSLALEAAVVEPILAEGSTDSLPTIFLRSKLAPEVEEANQGETLSLPEVKEDVKRLSRIVEIFSEAREAFEADLKASRKESSRPSEDAVLLESTIKIMTSGKL